MCKSCGRVDKIDISLSIFTLMHYYFKALIPMVILEGMSDYFVLYSDDKNSKFTHTHPKELNSGPSEYQSNKPVSKGTFDEVIF